MTHVQTETATQSEVVLTVLMHLNTERSRTRGMTEVLPRIGSRLDANTMRLQITFGGNHGTAHFTRKC
jgi:hypothetical protein